MINADASLVLFSVAMGLLAPIGCFVAAAWHFKCGREDAGGLMLMEKVGIAIIVAGGIAFGWFGYELSDH